MVLVIECVVLCVLFTVGVALALNDPLAEIGSYPKAIGKRCIELGLIQDRKGRLSKAEYIRKGITAVLLAVIFALVLRYINGAETFLYGFGLACIIWLVMDWYDVIVLDCLWFCHSGRVRIPGTEDMPEYRDYWFHIKDSYIGMLIGIPVCLLMGLIVTLF